MRVFISHSSKDKPQVEELARALAERGFEPWFDQWEIAGGDDLVGRINDGLERADAGIVVFSRHTRDSRWVEAEVNYLTYARIQEDKVLVPVMLDPEAWVPPLLRPLARRGFEEIDALADALRNRSAGPPPVRSAERGRVERVTLSLRPASSPSPTEADSEPGVAVEIRIGDTVHGRVSYDALPPALVAARTAFLRSPVAGHRRDRAAAVVAELRAILQETGQQMSALCFPEASGEALATILDGSPLGMLVEFCIEAEGTELLGLPFETLRLPDGRPLATHPKCILWRRPANLNRAAGQTMAGPLKILVAVGAPYEEATDAPLLDYERELQHILDAVEPLEIHENAEVRILEVGHPEEIAKAIEADAYHVLHLSCHGAPGRLLLENEDGEEVPTTAEELVGPLADKGRPLPLVFLNACHGAVQDIQTGSLAEDLLRAGVPSVLAMQTSVSDRYASDLARAFYQHLARGEHLLPSVALAAARKELEAERQAQARAGGNPYAAQPEYSTAALFVSGKENPLADFGLEKKPLSQRPVHTVAGPVPQLRIDELIGRRRELRNCLRTLRADSREHAGVVLTGTGGVGKSALAGRAMQRLVEAGYLVSAFKGRFDLVGLVDAVREAARGSKKKWIRELGNELKEDGLDDLQRLASLKKALASQRLVIVLDDFEQNLTVGGSNFLNPDVAQILGSLAQAAGRGRLLITCRHPIPGFEGLFEHLSIGRLSRAESRKLMLRLDALQRTEDDGGIDSKERAELLRILDGHPRSLEFANVLLGGEARRPRHLMEKLRELQAKLGQQTTADDGAEALQTTLDLIAQDVLLTELLAIAREEDIDEILLQVAVSNLPVTPEGAARMLVVGSEETEEVSEESAAAAKQAFQRLQALALLQPSTEGAASVHRWTAEVLAQLAPEGHAARCVRAGRYRLWRNQHESHDLLDALEAVRNFLQGQDFDAAAASALGCLQAFAQAQRTLDIAALASEVLETLPPTHGQFAVIADWEARAHISLGNQARAFERHNSLLARFEELTASEPDRADYQRDLSVSYDRMGDLFKALGQGDKAQDAFSKALNIAQQLAQQEPDRADYQRDLSVSYNKVGDLFKALGQGDKAQDAFSKALNIRQQLAQQEPDRADYQRDLSVSYERMGDLFKALGQGDKAQDAFSKALNIAQQLAQQEPDRADYQRDLSVSYNKLGNLLFALGQTEDAKDLFLKDLQIAQQLAQQEPDRADYQRDLVVSFVRVGTNKGAAGLVELRQAMAILQDLRATGRLNPVDEPMIPAVQRLIDATEATQD
ncbi:MAG: CHAT domain-containing protein [Acidobacteriota bacterium]|nr:CHAT domain-containing protein [Acidobacteriota bacterium]